MKNFNESAVLWFDDFTLRPIQSSDIDALAAIWADPEVTRFLPSRDTSISREDTKKSIKSFAEHWQQKKYGVWAIIENTALEMIGYCGLRYLSELDEVEILYGLARKYWGRGIASQAAKASISYGFGTVELDKIIAMALPDNQASIRVIEKAGLYYEKKIHIFDMNVLYYSILSRTA